MTRMEARKFEKTPYFHEIILMWRFDEAAKEPPSGVTLPGDAKPELKDYVSMMKRNMRL